MNTKEMFKLTWLPVIVASLCCLSPLIVVLIGTILDGIFLVLLSIAFLLFMMPIRLVK